jgi:hypothetical protein
VNVTKNQNCSVPAKNMGGLQSRSIDRGDEAGAAVTKDRMTRIRRKYFACEKCRDVSSVTVHQLYSERKIFLFA